MQGRPLRHRQRPARLVEWPAREGRAGRGKAANSWTYFAAARRQNDGEGTPVVPSLSKAEDASMGRIVGGIFVLVLGLSLAAGQKAQGKPATPAGQYKALLKEYQVASHDLFSRTKTDEERNKVLGSVDTFPLRFLELAEKYPRDPIALDALVQVVNLEISFENNTAYAGLGKQDSPQARAIALLLRDHLGSDKLGYACWRTSYGFHKDCERFLRTALARSPHKEVQGTACLRLAQFLKARLHRLDLLKERPEMARRYESLFGKDYLVTLQRQDPARAGAEVEALFERAIEDYPDVKLPYGGAVGEQAKRELYEIRHLSVGRPAPDIDGEDQDGKRFRLSDYRGKVVLLYFWSEY
jgi:hypothetical protein